MIAKRINVCRRRIFLCDSLLFWWPPGCFDTPITARGSAVLLAALCTLVFSGFARPALGNVDRTFLACAAITDDTSRLNCFDAAVASGANSRPSYRAIISQSSRTVTLPAALSPTGMTNPAQTPSAAAAPAPAGSVPRFRIAIGYGIGVGDHAGSFKVLSGHLDLQSAVGSSGGLVSAQVWADRFLGRDWTVGLEYLAIRNEGTATLTLPRGLSILTDPVTAGAQVKLRADLMFLNVAYRPDGGWVHPLIGGGVGIGYGHGSAGYGFENAFVGGFSGVAVVGKPIAGVQLFTGIEFDLGDHGYFSVMPRVVIIDGHPIGVDQRYMDFGVIGTLGWRL